MYDYREYLNSKLLEKKQRNEAYSLRSFARDLDISPGVLSKILNSKFTPSLAMALKITNQLKLRRIEQRVFVKAVVEDLMAEDENQNLIDFNEFDIDHYEIVSKWYNYAILELTLVENFKSDETWIASKFGLPVEIVTDAVERLLDVGMLEKVNGVLKKTNFNITTSNKHLTTPGLKEYQKSILSLAKESVDEVSFERRSMQTMTMAIDAKKVETARTMIEDFLNDMCEFLEADSQKEVYQMSVALFPLTERNKSE